VADDEKIYTEAQLAARYGKKPETVRDWRKHRKGPDYFKAGDTVLYRASDVARWEAEQVELAKSA
jgi:hypothetical protein